MIQKNTTQKAAHVRVRTWAASTILYAMFFSDMAVLLVFILGHGGVILRLVRLRRVVGLCVLRAVRLLVCDVLGEFIG